MSDFDTFVAEFRSSRPLSEQIDWDAPIRTVTDRTPLCPVCSKPAERRNKGVNARSYECREHNMRVKCHKGTWSPLGTMAGPDLRKLRKQVHAAFDPFWESGVYSRKEAYDKLATAIGLRKRQCHIGKFDDQLCKLALVILRDWPLRQTEEPGTGDTATAPGETPA